MSDRNWNSPNFVQKYQGVISSNNISEIFCRIAYVETDFFKLELPSKAPSFEVPQILVHLTATRSAKMWPGEYWQQVMDWCESQGLTVGLIGSAAQTQQDLYNAKGIEEQLLRTSSLIDLRGKTTLLELAGAFEQALACISVDAGPLHIAAAVGCPTLGIVGNDLDGDGASPIRLWAPRQSHVQLTNSNFKCNLCQENCFKNNDCLLEDHPCMQHLKPDMVIAQLVSLLSTTNNLKNKGITPPQRSINFSNSKVAVA